VDASDSRAVETAQQGTKIANPVIMSTSTRELRTSEREPLEDESPTIGWTVALSGGEAPGSPTTCGAASVTGFPSSTGCMSAIARCSRTRSRASTGSSRPSNTLTVIGTHHGDIAVPQLAGKSDHVFRQPAPRDTGLALYVALAMIKRWHPNALVTITPTDHYVAPSARYLEHVRAARGVAAQLRDTVILLGARPNEPDPDLGYLCVGDQLTEIPQVRRVTALVENPTPARARELIDRGALWNTWSRAEPSTHSGRSAARPSPSARHPRLARPAGRLLRTRTTRSSTSIVPTSRSARATCSSAHRTCSPCSGSTAIEWSDWGRPERIEAALALRRSGALIAGRARAP